MKPFKYILKTITLMVIVFSCTNNSENSQEEDLLALDSLKNEIELLINQGTCSQNTDCDFIAFGSKACGGPQGYLVYSTSINVTLLNEKVAHYNQQEKTYNIKWGIISDCSVPAPPSSVECIEGKCQGLYN